MSQYLPVLRLSRLFECPKDMAAGFPQSGQSKREPMEEVMFFMLWLGSHKSISYHILLVKNDSL
jgi:hypothetical protein